MAANGIKREVLVRAGSIAVRARLLDTPVADRIWQALPIYAAADRQEGRVAFPVLLQGSVPAEDAPLAHGAFAVDAERSTILIAWRPATSARAHVWALALDDVAPLAGLRNGDRLALLEADS